MLGLPQVGQPAAAASDRRPAGAALADDACGR